MPRTSYGAVVAKPVRFGIVGCGRIAQSHLEALAQSEEAALVAVVEQRKAAGEAVAEQYRCPLFTDHLHPDLGAMIDAVIVATPPNTHYQITRHFLENGIHVLCEKPLTIHPEEARELVRLSRERDLLLMMASKFRYVDDLIKAKAIVESGILGDIILFENTFCSKVLMKERWNAVRDLSGGGVLIDNGSHSIDIARYLLGPIKEVQAQNGIPAQDLEVEDTVRLQFRTQGGVIGMIDLSWSISKETDAYVSLFGTEGTLLVGWRGSRYRQDGNARWVPFGSGYDKVAAFSRQLGNFVRTLQGSELPIITAEDSLASVEVIEAAYASAKKNNWLSVEHRS